MLASILTTLKAVGRADMLSAPNSTRVLRITAEARNQEAMIDYLKRLSEVPGFGYVHLINHQVQQDHPQPARGEALRGHAPGDAAANDDHVHDVRVTA